MFFNYLSQVMTEGVDLSITVCKSTSGLTVMLLPRVNGLKDTAKNHIVPLRLSGTPQQLDANFFPAISAPVQKSSLLLVNMDQFEKAAEKAAANSKDAKDKKEKEAKTAKDKKEKYDNALKKAEEQETAGNLEEALKSLQTAKANATEKASKGVDEKITALKSKMSQGSLFDVPATPPTPQQTPAPVQAAAPAQQPAVQQAAPAQQQAAAPVEQPVMAAPAPQPQAQPVQGIQPNTEVFGMFSQQQAPVQQQAAPVQSPAPAQTAAPASGFDAMPFIQHELDVPACRDNEYEDIPDFPVEMAPPVYSGMQSQY